MNFKLNTLVAAALLVAAGTANAAIDNGNTTNGTGELFLTVVDTTAGYSFVGDLGVSMDSFLASSGASATPWNLSSFSAWTPFVAAIGGNLSNATFAVYAFDNVGATSTVNAKRLLTTVAAGDDISGLAGNYTTTNSKLGSIVGTVITTPLAQFQSDSNNLSNDHDTVANGSSYTSSAFNAGYVDAQYGVDLKANTQFVTTVAASGAADFWLLGNSSSSVGAQANTFQQAGQFSLSDTSLSYTVAAVPEADTYAMMLAGLGLVGFMVSRRKA
ncbi:MAG: PEP-CTERM sorting domain-containing protein [Thiobacillaceae bacterium]